LGLPRTGRQAAVSDRYPRKSNYGFSSAGYEAGGVALPVVPVVITIGPVSGDNTSHIQAAINTASQLAPDINGFRGAVLLGPGTYDLSGIVDLTAVGVVLRGSGSGASGSVLNLTGSPHLAISVSGSGSWQTVGTAASITDAYVPSGALSFTGNDASGFQVGDTVLIERPVTAPWVHFMGMDTLVRNGAPQTWIAVGGSVRTDRVVAAISGNRITLDVPLIAFSGVALLIARIVSLRNRRPRLLRVLAVGRLLHRP
jgi:hypothetical protein